MRDPAVQLHDQATGVPGLRRGTSCRGATGQQAQLDLSQGSVRFGQAGSLDT